LTFKRAKRLRRSMTLPEVVLWPHLRGGQMNGLRFRRQHAVGPYILDFYCSEARLCIEVDGSTHNIVEQAAHNDARTLFLQHRGIRVLRFAAADILNDEALAEVWQSIGLAAAPSTAVPAVPSPALRVRSHPTEFRSQVPPPRSGRRGTGRSPMEGAAACVRSGSPQDRTALICNFPKRNRRGGHPL
jgi:very-short-patch-repair endonuclease